MQSDTCLKDFGSIGKFRRAEGTFVQKYSEKKHSDVKTILHFFFFRFETRNFFSFYLF